MKTNHVTAIILVKTAHKLKLIRHGRLRAAPLKMHAAVAFTPRFIVD